MGACLARICGETPRERPPNGISTATAGRIESVAPAAQLIDFAALERTASQVLSRIVEHAEVQASDPQVAERASTAVAATTAAKRLSVSRATEVRPISRPSSRQVSQTPSPSVSPPPPRPASTTGTIPLRRTSGFSSLFARAARDGQDPWAAQDIDLLAVGDIPQVTGTAASRGRELSLGGYEEELDLVHLDDAYLETERERTSRKSGSDRPSSSGGDPVLSEDFEALVLASQTFAIRGREYVFSIASAPRKCNTSGSVTMTPPLVARLRASDETGTSMAALEDHLPYLIAQVTVPERASPPASLASQRSTRSYTRDRNGSQSSTDERDALRADVRGTRTTSPTIYRDQNDEQGVFFVFPDLQIVTEGSWRVAVSLVALWPPEHADEIDMSQSSASADTDNRGDQQSSSGGGGGGGGSDGAAAISPPVEAAVLATVTSPHAVRVLPESWPLGHVPQGLDRDTQLLLATLRHQGAVISGSPSMLNMLDDIAVTLNLSPAMSRTTISDNSMRSLSPDPLSPTRAMEAIPETPLSPESMTSL